MAKREKTTVQFAVCVDADDSDLLTPRMIYQVLPDESAARSNYIRVIDDEGEDYLYPAENFILMDFPPAVERALLQVSGQEKISGRLSKSRTRATQRKSVE